MTRRPPDEYESDPMIYIYTKEASPVSNSMLPHDQGFVLAVKSSGCCVVDEDGVSQGFVCIPKVALHDTLLNNDMALISLVLDDSIETANMIVPISRATLDALDCRKTRMH